jgi:hypothetical protein
MAGLRGRVFAEQVGHSGYYSFIFYFFIFVAFVSVFLVERRKKIKGVGGIYRLGIDELEVAVLRNPSSRFYWAVTAVFPQYLETRTRLLAGLRIHNTSPGLPARQGVRLQSSEPFLMGASTAGEFDRFPVFHVRIWGNGRTHLLQGS